MRGAASGELTYLLFDNTMWMVNLGKDHKDYAFGYVGPAASFEAIFPGVSIATLDAMYYLHNNSLEGVDYAYFITGESFD